MLLTWRIELRSKLKLVRQAKLAEKFFIFRKAWRIWVHRADENMREKKLVLFHKQKLKKYFNGMISVIRFFSVVLTLEL